MPNLTPQETATILAGLRMFQNARITGQDVASMPHFAECEPLDEDAMMNLCERLNFGDDDEPDGMTDEQYIAAAREQHGVEGECEIDDNAVISRGTQDHRAQPQRPHSERRAEYVRQKAGRG